MRALSLKTLVLVAGLALMLGCKSSDQPVKPATPSAQAPTKADPAKAATKAASEAAAKTLTTGVTKDRIKIGQMGPQTGPAALWGAVARGTRAYFDMINAEGGIHGRKLELLIRDDAYQPPRTKAGVMELVEKEGVFAFVGGLGTGPCMAVKSYLADRKIPWVGPASGSSKLAKIPTRYLFSVYPQYETESRLMVRHLLENEKKTRIGVIYLNDDYGKEGLEGARAELKAAGLAPVAEISAEMSDQDLSSHVLKLKASGADAVLVWLMPKQAAITLGTAAKLGFKPTWVASSALSDAPLMHKVTKGLWEGVLYASIMELPNSEHPLVVKYRKAYEDYGKKYNEKEVWSLFYMAGFTFAEPFVEGLRRAGPDLDREKFVAAMETIKAWNKGIGHSITFGPNIRQGQTSIFIARCEGGQGVRVTRWIDAE